MFEAPSFRFKLVRILSQKVSTTPFRQFPFFQEIFSQSNSRLVKKVEQTKLFSFLLLCNNKNWELCFGNKQLFSDKQCLSEKSFRGFFEEKGFPKTHFKKILKKLCCKLLNAIKEIRKFLELN